MLTLYRRYFTACPHTSMRYKRCRCPIWVFGSLDGKRMRKSMNLTNWEAAQSLVRDWEVDGAIERDTTTVEGAKALSRFANAFAYRPLGFADSRTVAENQFDSQAVAAAD